MTECYRILNMKELERLVSKDEVKPKIDYQNKIACFDVHIIIVITNSYYFYNS